MDLSQFIKDNYGFENSDLPNITDYKPKTKLPDINKTKFIELMKIDESLPDNLSNEEIQTILEKTGLYEPGSVKSFVEGGLAKTFKAILNENKKNMILKVEIFLAESQKFTLFKNEIELNRKIQDFASLSSLGIFKTYYISFNDSEDKRKIGVIELEQAEKTLSQILKENSRIGEEYIRKICVDLIRYLGMLHSENIAHCDIKPENIFYIQTENKFILGDFGISQSFTLNELDSFFEKEQQCFKMDLSKYLIGWTRPYNAPELNPYIDGCKKKIDQKYFEDLFLCDVYSLGIVFLKMSMRLHNRKNNKKLTMDEIPYLIEKYPIYLNYEYNEKILFNSDDLEIDIPKICDFDKRNNPIIKEFFLKTNENFRAKENENKKQAIFTKKKINILSLMLQKNPQDRFNIFEILLLLDQKSRFLFPKNPNKKRETLKPGTNGDYLLVLNGYSLKQGDLTVLPYYISVDYEISLKKTKKKAYILQYFMQKTNFMIEIEENFEKEKGFFNLEKKSENVFIFRKLKSLAQNKKIFHINFEEIEILRISLSCLAAYIKTFNIEKIEFDIHYTNIALEKLKKSIITLTGNKKDFQKIEIVLLKDENIKYDLFCIICIEFLRKIIQSASNLKTFKNNSFLEITFHSEWFNALMLNFILFYKEPNNFFTKYIYKNESRNNYFRLYSFRNFNEETNIKYLNDYINFPHYQSLNDIHLELDINCKEELINPEEDQVNIINNARDLLDLIKYPDFYQQIKKINLIFNENKCIHDIVSLFEKCINLSEIQVTIFDEYEESFEDSKIKENMLIQILTKKPLKIIDVQATRITSAFINNLCQDSEIMKNLKILALGKADISLNSFKSLILHPNLKLKVLDIRNVKNINENFSNILLNSNIKYYLRTLKMPMFSKKHCLNFIEEVLINKENVLENLIFNDEFGRYTVDQEFANIIKAVMENYEKYLFIDVCEKRIESNLYKIFTFDISEEVFDEQKLKQIIFDYQKNIEVFYKNISSLLNFHKKWVFQNIDFPHISNIYEIFKNENRAYAKIKSIEFRDCKIPLKLLNFLILNNSISHEIELDPRDIEETNDESFIDSLALFFQRKILKKEINLLYIIFEENRTKLEIDVDVMTLRNFSLKNFSDLCQNTASQLLLKQIYDFDYINIDLSRNFKNFDLESQMKIINRLIFQNKGNNNFKTILLVDLNVLISSLSLEESNSNIKRLDLTICQFKETENLNKYSFLAEKIIHAFKNLIDIEIFFDILIKKHKIKEFLEEIENFMKKFLIEKMIGRFKIFLKKDPILIDSFFEKDSYKIHYDLEKKNAVKNELMCYEYKKKN